MTETATRDRTVREAGTITPGKTIKERRVCDWCEKTNPPIRECAITLSKTAIRWYDLCPDCVETSAPLQSLLAAPQPRQGASDPPGESRDTPHGRCPHPLQKTSLSAPTEEGAMPTPERP